MDVDDTISVDALKTIQGKLNKVPEAMVWKPIIESQAQWYDVGEVDVVGDGAKHIGFHRIAFHRRSGE